MAAISLFWDTNMAAVTSCENTLVLGSTPDTSTRISFFRVCLFHFLGSCIILNRVNVRGRKYVFGATKAHFSPSRRTSTLLLL